MLTLQHHSSLWEELQHNSMAFGEECCCCIGSPPAHPPLLHRHAAQQTKLYGHCRLEQGSVLACFLASWEMLGGWGWCRGARQHLLLGFNQTEYLGLLEPRWSWQCWITHPCRLCIQTSQSSPSIQNPTISMWTPLNLLSIAFTKPLQIEWSNQSWFPATSPLSRQAEHVAVLVSAKNDFWVLKTFVLLVLHDLGSALDESCSNFSPRSVPLAN